MVELLSPAGEINSFKSAIENGANAIYMGTTIHNARVMANNFSVEEYIDCIHYAHIRGVKVYLTLNTLVYDDEIEEAMKLLIKLYSHGLDAVIIQDIGLLDCIKKVLPDIDVHASTQMSVHNLEQVKYMEKLGFSRVVLARELTLKEIEYICKNSNIEIEVFVHGALCVSVSGQCLMSSMIGSRSGNRGKCAGPCRVKYNIYENGKKIYGDRYLLSKKDIFGLDYIHKLIDIGITSLKIEGRSKSPEYVGLVTDKYRKCIDDVVDDIDRKQLHQMFIRTGESSGYFEKVVAKESISENTPKNTGLKLGTILATRKHYIKVMLEENIDLHDGIEINSEGNIASTIVTCIKNERFVTINKEVEKGNIVWLGDIPKTVKIGDTVYKTSSSKLNEEYRNKLTKINRKVLVSGTVNILKDSNINMDVNLNGNIFNVSIEYVPQISINKPIESKDVFNQFSKTVDSPFEFINLNYNIDDSLFVPVSKLNELRRKIIEKLEDSFVINRDVAESYKKLDEYISNSNRLVNENKLNREHKNSLFIYKYNLENENKYFSDDSEIIYINIFDIRRYELKGIDILSKYMDKKDVYVYIPNVVLANLDKYIIENLDRVVKLGAKGILLGNIGYLDLVVDLKSKYNLKLVADYSLNIANVYAALFYKEKKVDKVAISPELDICQAENISKIIDAEIVQNYVTAMTSRFCPVKSYSGGCKCHNNAYLLKDIYNRINYNIVCDNTDCIVKLVRDIPKKIDIPELSRRKCEIE